MLLQQIRSDGQIRQGNTVDDSSVPAGSVRVIGPWGTDVWRTGEYFIVDVESQYSGPTPGTVPDPLALIHDTARVAMETAQFEAMLGAQVECP